METLIFFGPTHLDDMLKKGNVWYVRHYEAYFDKVYIVYLLGKPHEPVVNGNTTLVSLGTGSGIVDLVLSPYRLYQFSKKVKPTSYLTADQVFSWWTSCLVKLLLGAKIYLMPVCMPELIYKSSGRSVSGFPIWLERLSIPLSYALSNRVLTGHSFGSFVKWLYRNKWVRNKLVVVDTIVDSLPSNEFLEKLRNLNNEEQTSVMDQTDFKLVYVGRMHREKLVDDLIKMMLSIKEMNNNSVSITLNMIGDGPELNHLEQLANELDVADVINFLGTITNDRLPEQLIGANMFVSPLTGTSLREAALCGLPIVAYDMDWISGLLKHEKTALLVSPGDFEGMAHQVMRLVNDQKLRERISQNVKELAWRLWSPQGARESLSKAFKEN